MIKRSLLRTSSTFCYFHFTCWIVRRSDDLMNVYVKQFTYQCQKSAFQLVCISKEE